MLWEGDGIPIQTRGEDLECVRMDELSAQLSYLC